MKTYLFAWNSKLWKWNDISKMGNDVKNGKNVFDRWGTGTSKKIQKGDKFFIIRLGEEPRGIFASGQVTSDVYEDIHWRKEKSSIGKTANYVKIKYDVLLNPEKDVILPREILQQPPFSQINWDIRMSGIQIPDSIVKKLETIWKTVINNNV
ncbi:MAG: EVE domain-containing protein [Anaerolineales bacterium]|nr:EVE domain-containing protein [Anaerolineales bacterium]